MQYLALIALLFASSLMAAPSVDCSKAVSTLEINQCMGQDLKVAEGEMQHYLAASLKKNDGDALSQMSIKKGQQAWLEYRKAHCSAVYDTWREETVRTAMSLGCALQLTHQRTHTLWSSFLQMMDSSPAVLPEPKLYQPKRY